MKKKPKIAISSCLLGNNVRYNGQNTLDKFIKETLGKFFDFFPICPETECGLGTPREPIQLVEFDKKRRLITVQTKKDLSENMASWIKKRIPELEKEQISAFIFMSRSPSCGLDDVNIYDCQGKILKIAAGVFATAIRERFKLTPLIDNKKIHSLANLAYFLLALFTLSCLRKLKNHSGKIS